MNIHSFHNLDLKVGDFIWIQVETGEGFYGRYRGQNELSADQFCFYSHTTGGEEIREISKLQRLERQKD